MKYKFRTPDNILRGRKNAPAKLTAEQVSKIKQMLSDPTCSMSQTSMASEYGVTKQTIGDINNGKTWRHVESRC